jgi:hypothetical protein
MTVTSLNSYVGTLVLTGFGTSTGGTVGNVQLSNGTTTLSIGNVVTSFQGSSENSPSARSGAVTLTAGDVTSALSAGNIYNLIDYGGDPTGANDSSTALGNCITAAASAPSGIGGLVYIPSGSYLLTSPVSVSSSNNISIKGDGPYTTFLSPTHSGTALTLTETFPFSSVSITGLSFFANDVSGTSDAALNITMPGVPTAFPGCPYIALLIEDVRIFGNGSLNPPTTNKAFRAGIRLRGCVNARFNRISFLGVNNSTGAAIELTSATEIHIDSCNLQDAAFGVAIMDGGCQGIYIRNGTFVNLNYLLASATFTAYNSSVTETLSANSSSKTITLQSLGQSPLDSGMPAIGAGMQVTSGVSGSVTVTSVTPASGTITSNTVTLSQAETLTAGTALTFQYTSAGGYKGIQMAIVNSEINTQSGVLQLGYWSGLRVHGNNVEPPPSTSSTAFALTDVASCSIVGNNIQGNPNTNTNTAFHIQFAVLDCSNYIITGNNISSQFATLCNIGANTFFINFEGNDTGQSIRGQFADGNNGSAPANLILYNSASSSATQTTLTSYHTLTITGLV